MAVIRSASGTDSRSGGADAKAPVSGSKRIAMEILAQAAIRRAAAMSDLAAGHSRGSGEIDEYHSALPFLSWSQGQQDAASRRRTQDVPTQSGGCEALRTQVGVAAGLMADCRDNWLRWRV